MARGATHQVTGGKIEKTENSRSRQRMPRSFAASTTAVPSFGAGAPAWARRVAVQFAAAGSAAVAFPFAAGGTTVSTNAAMGIHLR
jgi:hypothetical protein